MAESRAERLIAEAREKGATELYLGEVRRLPRSLLQLSKLKRISIDGLISLPTWIGELTQLEVLSVNQGHLLKLPKSIAKLKNLRWLHLTDSKLSSIPVEIVQLERLEILDLDGNPLLHVPDVVFEIQSIEGLNICNIGINSIPDAISRLRRLRALAVTGNRLVTLPSSIASLSKLDSLYLYRTGLRAIPEAVSKLRNLRRLQVGANNLTSLPDFICSMDRLSILHAKRNRLTVLPESIGNLSRLEELDLSYNQLTALPPSLRSLSALKRLYLHGNEVLGIPQEVLGVLSRGRNPDRPPANPANILDYYFRVRGGERPLNEAKLIFVGRGGVGKTSLVNRLVHARFDRNEAKTEGICITHWPLTLRADERVRLNVWDFGGQEIMHATHQFFLTQRSLYVLVLNGREGGEDLDADYWLRLIASFGGDSPVVIVLNKIREQPFDLNRRGLQQKYPNIRDILRTDCEDGAGIDELRRAIERETDRLPNLRDAFPASWFSIKDRLAGMPENYLSFERYRQVCADLGETDAGAQEALAGYLHSLGVALNYKDDPRLRDKHVLNPHWVTSGIYTLLNAPRLASQSGMLRITDLSETLDAATYPPEMHGFLLDLMKRFELCFSFPDDDERYLVPELLDKQEPEAAGQFKPEECLNFQYHYPILPEGLLPRFIVRTHALSEGRPRWRSGVVLGFEGNEALVKADVQDRTVVVRVTGPTEGRRRLLAIIRSDFDRIHRSIERLQPDEMVPLPGRPTVAIRYHKLAILEREGEQTVKEVVGDEVVTIDVSALLNGVDLDDTPRRTSLREEEAKPITLFYSYSHKDEALRDELETHLKLLQRRRLIDGWHDRRIAAGEEWSARIDEHLDRADIILLLISSDFLASDYYDAQIKRALERHDAHDARVVPIILRDVSLEGAPFARLTPLPKDGVPVTKWPNRDSAWRDVSEGIERLVQAIQKARRLY
jgi:internalin A